MRTQWLMVADAGRAQIFATDAVHDVLEPVQSHVHPASRIETHDLVSGPRGSMTAGPGGAHSSFERHTDPHRVEIESFARELAAAARSGRVEHEFEELIVVAPPRLLGLIRSHLDVDTERCLVGSIAHDWMDIPQRELLARVRTALAGAPTS
ncbi:MAG: host attachment protein [Myxococcota bacterium]